MPYMPSREARSSSYLDFDSKEDSGSGSAAHSGNKRSSSSSGSGQQQQQSSSRRHTHRAGAKSMYTGFNYDCDELDDDDLTTASYREMAKNAAPESAAISRYVLYTYITSAAAHSL
jgi:hypothetical protein